MPPLLVLRDYSLTINNAICLSLVVLSLDPSQPTMPTLLSSLSLHINNVWAIINQFGHLGHTILKRLLWFSLHNIVLCRLSGVGVVHAVSPRYWMLRTSGSLALGKFLKRTSHLFCTLCTPPRLLLVIDHPTGISETCPKQYESTRLCLKTVAPSNTDRNESYRWTMTFSGDQ